MIGRYAFVIVNLGGMLDVNRWATATPSPTTETPSRQRPHQADFTAIRLRRPKPPLDGPALRQRLVQWRWGQRPSTTPGSSDPKRSFLEPEEDQTLVFSRNELLAFSEKEFDLLTRADLACLTVGSYMKERSEFRPRESKCRRLHAGRESIDRAQLLFVRPQSRAEVLRAASTCTA